MKRVSLAAVLLLVFIPFAPAQQPSGSNRRRGLDQIDLLSIKPSASGPSMSGPAVEVDLDTYQLLEPLVRHCRELEQIYRTTILEGDKNFADSYEALATKALAIHRSTILIRKIKTLSPQATALVDSSEEIGKDVARTAALIQFANDTRFNNDDDFKKEAAQLFEQYGVARSSDLVSDGKQLLAVVLRRLNANFGRLKIAG